MELAFSIAYAVAIFVASNVVSFPLGFINGFLEVRKQPLSQRSRLVLEFAEGVIEVLVWIVITVHLFRQQFETPYLVAAGAYGLAGVIGYVIDVRVFKKSRVTFLIRILFTSAFCVVVGAYVA